MIAPLLRHLSPEGDGALLAMTPEQVIQHYRKRGMPERRGRSPRERSYRAFDFLTLKLSVFFPLSIWGLIIDNHQF